MVAGKTSGGAVRGVGGVDRGGSGIATRGSGGKETSGGFSSGKSFGNTSRFERSFSGRSLATASRPARTESRSGAARFGPRLESVRTHSLDSHRPNISAFKETKPIYVSKADAKYHAKPGHSRFHTEPKGALSKPKLSSRSFGPKLEAVKASSPDTHRPATSLNKNTAILFSRSEVRPKSEPKTAPKVSPKMFGPRFEAVRQPAVDRNRPGVSAFRVTRPLYQREQAAKPRESTKSLKASFGPKLEAVRTQSADINRPQASPVRETVPMYQRPEVKPRAAEQKQQVVSKERHPLYTGTQELKLRNEQATTQQTRHALQEPSRSMYERSQSKTDPRRDHIMTTPAGERSVVRVPVDNSGRWNQVLAKKSVDGRAIQEQRGKKQEVLTSQGKTGRAPTNEGLNVLRKKTQAKSSPKSDLLMRTEPLQLTTPARLEQRAQGSMNMPQEQLLRNGRSWTAAGSIVSTPEQQAVTVLPQAETQRVLDTYLLQTREKAGGVSAQPKQISVAEISSPEARADIEQAARVMQAYKNVLQTGTYAGVSMARVEHAVINALDLRLERAHVKTALLTAAETATDLTPASSQVPGLQPMMSSERQMMSLPHAVALAEVEGEGMDPKVAALLRQVQVAPELLPVPAVQQLITKARLQAQTETETMTAETNEQISTVTARRGSSTVSARIAGAMQPSEALYEEEKEEAMQEQTDEQMQQLESAITYERDEVKNMIRISVVVYISVFLQYIRREKVIPGNMIAAQMVRIYDPLVSDIVPEGRPDDNLTAFIESIAEKEYTSIVDVVADVTALAHEYTAITVGTSNNITAAEAARLRYSTKYPTITSRSTSEGNRA